MRRCSLAQSKYSAMNVWALRQRRNDIIWKNKTKPPIDVVNQATQLVEDWQFAKTNERTSTSEQTNQWYGTIMGLLWRACMDLSMASLPL